MSKHLSLWLKCALITSLGIGCANGPTTEAASEEIVGDLLPRLNNDYVQDVYVDSLGTLALRLGPRDRVELRNVSAGGDPMMALVKTSNGVIFYQTRRAGERRIDISERAARRDYTLYVWGRLGRDSRGRARVFVNGQDRGAIQFGGHEIPVRTGEDMVFHSVHRPTGVESSQLLGFSNGRLVEVGLPSVGNQVSMRSRSDFRNIDRVIAGSIDGSDGLLRIVADETTIGIDRDRDGLGRNLERALGTCDSTDDPFDYCRDGIPHDTDRDGIKDGWEVLGRAGSSPVYLPRWGADPLHKDIFVEMDIDARFCPTAPAPCLTPLTYDEAETIQEAFADNLGNIENPSGRPGIRMHIDAGPGAPLGDTWFQRFTNRYVGLVGDWNPDDVDIVPGGAQLTGLPHVERARDNRRDIADGLNINATYFAPSRRGIFRYTIRHTDTDGRAGHGQPFFDHGRATAFAHELGHTMNLDHEGTCGAFQINRKPNYMSIMNYRYSENTSVQFSDGRNISLDPLNIDEGEGLGRVLTPDEVALFQGQGYLIDADNTGIDWNRNGRIDPMRVRANISNPGNHSPSGIGLVHGQVLTESLNASSMSTEVFRFGDRLVVLYVDTDAQGTPVVVYQSAPWNPREDDLSSRQPARLRWTSPTVIPGALANNGFSATVTRDRIYIASMISFGSVVPQIIEGTMDRWGRFRQSTSYYPTVPAGVTPAAAAPEIYRTGRSNVRLMWAATDGRLYEHWRRGSQEFLPARPVLDNGFNHLSVNPQLPVTPQIIYLDNPSGSNQGETACGAFVSDWTDPSVTNFADRTDFRQRIRIRCQVSNRWEQHGGNVANSIAPEKPGFAFVFDRTADGSLLPDRSGRFLTAWVDRTRIAVTQSTTFAIDNIRLNAGVTPAGFGFSPAGGPEGERDSVPATTIALYADQETRNMKGLWWAGRSAPELQFSLHADSIANVGLQHDCNDYDIINDGGLCEGTNGGACYPF